MYPLGKPSLVLCTNGCYCCSGTSTEQSGCLQAALGETDAAIKQLFEAISEQQQTFEKPGRTCSHRALEVLIVAESPEFQSDEHECRIHVALCRRLAASHDVQQYVDRERSDKLRSIVDQLERDRPPDQPACRPPAGPRLRDTAALSTSKRPELHLSKVARSPHAMPRLKDGLLSLQHFGMRKVLLSDLLLNLCNSKWRVLHSKLQVAIIKLRLCVPAHTLQLAGPRTKLEFGSS